MKYIRLKIIILSTLVHLSLYGQGISIDTNINLNIYLEGYYGYDFSLPLDHNRPSFVYNHHRTSEININLALIELDYQKSRVRADLGIMFGTYAQANMAHEPAIFRNIYQAKIGYKIANSKNLWLDFGIMESHIGHESAKGGNHYNLTRNLLSENTPYYSAGAQLSYTSKNNKFNASLLALNGWQQITKPENYRTIALGHQVQYKPNDQLTFNSSSYFGSWTTNLDPKVMIFHNFYVQFEKKKFGIIATYDFAFQSKFYNYDVYFMNAAIIEGIYHINNKFSLAGRVEYFNDPKNILIASFETQQIGNALTINYKASQELLFRLEGKIFNSEKSIYHNNTRKSNQVITGAIIFNI